MGIIMWIILGALVGWIASKIMGTDAEQGAVANIVVGIIGAFLGGFVMSLFGKPGANLSDLNLYSLIVALVGACIALGIYRAITGRRHSTI